MPDFLHQDTEHDIQPEAGSVEARPKTRHETVKPAQLKKTEKDDKEKKKKKPSRLFVDYYGVIFLLLVAIFILAGFVLLWPLISEFKMTNAEIGSTVQTLKDERDYLESLQRSIAAAETIPADTLMRVDEALPRRVGLPKLLQTMSLIAEQNGVQLSSVQFNEPKQSSTETQQARALSAAPLDINLTLNSPSYAATRRFLESVERNLRVLDVQQITVTSNEQSGELTYTLQLRTYTLNAPVPRTPSQLAPVQTASVP